jgi:hypothetical protein
MTSPRQTSRLRPALISLPLTPFEAYMLADGTPSHPMDFLYRLRFDQPLADEDALRSALSAALARHPLLAARVEHRPGQPPRFVAPPGDVLSSGRFADCCILTMAPDATGELPAVPAIDLASGPLMRLIRLRPLAGAGTDGCDLLAHFHHVACDGLGAIAFLADLLELLDAQTTGRQPSLEPLQPQRLHYRGRYGLDGRRLLASLPAQARGLEGVWKFVRHRPARLAGSAAVCDAIPRPAPLAACTATFTAHEAAMLRRAAGRQGVSVNELAAATLFTALCDAVPRAAIDGPRRVIRLSIPVNLRQLADRRTPAANVVSMVFLDRSAAEIADAPRLVASIHEEMQLIKRLGLGLTFIFTLAAASVTSGGVAKLVRNRSTAATALFTNLGRVLRRPQRLASRAGGRRHDDCVRVGQSRLVAIEVLAPLRRGTAVAVAAVEYAGTLAFTLRYDPLAVSASTATRIRDEFVSHLHRQLATVATSGVVATADELVEAAP